MWSSAGGRLETKGECKLHSNLCVDACVPATPKQTPAHMYTLLCHTHHTYQTEAIRAVRGNYTTRHQTQHSTHITPHDQHTTPNTPAHVNNNMHYHSNSPAQCMHIGARATNACTPPQATETTQCDTNYCCDDGARGWYAYDDYGDGDERRRRLLLCMIPEDYEYDPYCFT